MPAPARPYVGITGFMSRGEVDHVLQAWPVDSNFSLMVGVLASSKTLAGLTNKWPNRYPRIGEIAGIFPDDARSLNLIHYATDTPDRLSEELLRLQRLSGPRLHGFQLNVPWPETGELAKYLQASPGSYIVLQLGSRALDQVAHDPTQLRNQLVRYVGLISSVLVDTSGGLGRSLDAEVLRNILTAIRPLPLGLGVAGGLSANSIGLLGNLPKEFPGLSIDAEGRLRDPRTDHLVADEAGAFLEAAQGVLYVEGSRGLEP